MRKAGEILVALVSLSAFGALAGCAGGESGPVVLEEVQTDEGMM